MTSGECFGTVPIHSSELDEALQGISLSPEVVAGFTTDQKYLCKRMGTPAPLLPVHGEKEFALFDKMVRSSCSDLDMENMAIEWCNHVDGTDIFPKLPAYLRTHHSKWIRNQLVREAVEKAAAGEAVLRQMNEETLRQLVPVSHSSPDPAGSPLDALAAAAAQTERPMADTSPFVPIALHPVMPPAVFPVHSSNYITVGGTHISGSLPPQISKRGHGKRQGDKKHRKPRKCRRCMKNLGPEGEAQALSCKGRAAKGT